MKKILSALLLSAAVSFAPAAMAEETVDITVASSHPTVIPWIGFIQSHFMPKVDEILAKTGNFKVNWQEAFGGQLYKANATLTSVEEGVTDIGWVFSYLEAAKMPLSQVTGFTPFTTTNVPAQLGTLGELYESFPEFKKEWEQYNLVYLGATGSDSYDLYTKKPINDLSDLIGVKLSAPGVLGTWLRGVGATAVDGALPTFYTDIQTGVSDGALSLALGVLPTKIYEVAPYITRVNFGTVFSGGLAINKDTWDSLDKEVQDAMLAAGQYYSDEHAKDMITRHEIFMDKMVELGKDQDVPVTISVMPEEMRQEWINRLPDLAGEWASATEARGIPAKAFLKAYMDGLREKGEKPLRNWDLN